MKGPAFLIASLLFATTTSAGTIFGVNCTPNATNQCPTTTAAVEMAQALHASIYRVRINVPHPVYDGTYGSATSSTLSHDFDPIAAALPPYDTSDCPGFIAYALQLNSSSGFLVGDEVYSDIFTGGSAAICAKIGSTIYTTTLPNQYVNTSLINSAPALIAALRGADPPIPVDLTVFNSNAPGKAADGKILDDVGHYQDRLRYMFALIGGASDIAVVTAGNEEDGGAQITCNGVQNIPQSECPVTESVNGDTGDLDGSGNETNTLPNYIAKLTQLCAVAHGFSPRINCAGSGVTVVGAQLNWFNYLWNICGMTWTASCPCASTSDCQAASGVFIHSGFSKSLHESNLAQNLPTICNSFSPALQPPQTLRVERVDYIAANEPVAGADYANLHYYDVPYQSENGASQYFGGLEGLPLMFNEFGTYSRSWVDVLNMMHGVMLLGAVYAEWWNQEGAVPEATALTDPYSGGSVSIRPNGAGWNAVIAGTAPSVLSGTALGSPC